MVVLVVVVMMMTLITMIMTLILLLFFFVITFTQGNYSYIPENPIFLGYILLHMFLCLQIVVHVMQYHHHHLLYAGYLYLYS
jgi:hypothetical protein